MNGEYSVSCEDESLLSCIIETVAWVKGVDPLALEPLYNAVEIEALEELYSPPRQGLTVSFTYAGCDVQIDSDGTITVAHEPDPVSEEVASASNILVLEASTMQDNEEVCSDLLATEPAHSGNVLCVSLSPGLGHIPVQERSSGNLGLLTVGDFTRSTSDQALNREPQPGQPQIATVPHPGDLSTLGIRIGEFLSLWAEGDHPTVICVHSLDDLLQQADLAHVFGFLLLLTNRLASADATAHYHFNEAAHDEKTVATLTPLFDTVLTHDLEKGWTTLAD